MEVSPKLDEIGCSVLVAPGRGLTNDYSCVSVYGDGYKVSNEDPTSAGAYPHKDRGLGCAEGVHLLTVRRSLTHTRCDRCETALNEVSSKVLVRCFQGYTVGVCLD